MSRLPAATLFFSLIIFSGCNKNKIYDRIIDMPGRSWPKDQSLDFQFSLMDSGPDYRISYSLRNSIHYKYYNLYLSCTIQDTLGNILESKLTNFNLFDPKTGEPLGDGMGDLFDHKLVAFEKYHFDNPGEYILKVRQYMREDTLMEIMALGLMVEKTDAPM
jgi:gliding motility-associated lipoprotein GldH